MADLQSGADEANNFARRMMCQTLRIWGTEMLAVEISQQSINRLLKNSAIPTVRPK